MKINENYLNLKESYLFSLVAKKQREFKEKNPEATIYRMSIGDVTKPLCKNVITAMRSAVSEMSKQKTFKGSGDEQGYTFLRESIAKHYDKYGVKLNLNEIFISDGAKSDLGNILDIFSLDNTVMVPDPVYPVYVDSNVMSGRKITYIKATKENKFLPLPDENIKADIIYICSPNNPTGAVYNKEQLKLWVDFAIKNDSIILFDSAYEYFINDDLPHSIYEIENSKKCAVEICSFSKTAGFTGVRCGYTVVPDELVVDGIKINKLWLRRQTTKFNGVCYIVQKGASKVFDGDEAEIKQAIDYYRKNAKIITDTLDELDIFYVGGKNSPYVFFECPNNMESWDFFDLLLEKANIVGTPGSGFGENGKNFFRLTSFSSRKTTVKAMENFKKLIKSLKNK